MTYSHDELRACAEREVAQRRRVYPRLVENKRMTKALADSETAKMEAIATHFAELAKGDRLI